MKLGVATQRPEHVVGIHFFNPVPVLPLVELVPSLLTAPGTVRRSRAFVEDQLGRKRSTVRTAQASLALADLIGLDTTKAVADSLYDEFKEPLYAAPSLLQRMVDSGRLGRKAGRGFYNYEGSPR